MTTPIVGVVAAELIQNLIALGYLVQPDSNNHARVTRAITRFQRHAARPYRLPGPDVAPTFAQAAKFPLDKQPTFLDEMELIGVDEARLRACGWNTDAMLDHAPG